MRTLLARLLDRLSLARPRCRVVPGSARGPLFDRAPAVARPRRGRRRWLPAALAG